MVQINRINEIFQNPHNQSLPGGRKGSGVATIFQVVEGHYGPWVFIGGTNILSWPLHVILDSVVISLTAKSRVVINALYNVIIYCIFNS